MEPDKVVHSGFLFLPPQGKIVLKKSWQKKFCLLYKQSKFGIERLEIYDSVEDVSKQTAPKIITLENCVKITPKPPHLFTVITKMMQYDFATDGEGNLTDWVSAFQSVAFKDDVSKITHIEEDNDLYCSSGEGVFSVKLYPSDASKRCGLEQKLYTLVLTPTAIQLRNIGDNKILYIWPYCYIRRYGYRSGKFTFEAGRKCDSGEGIFHLEHSNQQEIFRCLSSKMKSMKKVLSGESTCSLLDCGDNQFQAALNMEARSRSPLPPSPTSSTRIHDIDHSNSSQSSTKTIISLSDTTDKSISERLPYPKPRPSKPPRKNVPFNNSIKYIPQDKQIYDMYEKVDKTKPLNYDEIEYRKEAWRTLGIVDIRHTESIENEELEEYFSYGQPKSFEMSKNKNIKMIRNLGSIDSKSVDNSADDDLEEYVSWGRPKSPDPLHKESLKNKKIIPNTSNTMDENYDKLQFFGSSSKLCNTQPGYKQVMSPAHSSNFVPSWNDYDEVAVNMQAVRLADDSHLGYGMIRKGNQQKGAEVPPVSHQVYNDTAYALVSKPKRV